MEEEVGGAWEGLEPWILSVSALRGLALWPLMTWPWLGSSEFGLWDQGLVWWISRSSSRPLPNLAPQGRFIPETEGRPAPPGDSVRGAKTPEKFLSSFL